MIDMKLHTRVIVEQRVVLIGYTLVGRHVIRMYRIEPEMNIIQKIIVEFWISEI
jgi:hypothetical protein